MLADEIGPIGPDPTLWAILALAALGFLAVGVILGWTARGLDREDRLAERAAAEERERRAAQLKRVGPPGVHRVPAPDLLHEDYTMDLGPFRPLGDVRWY